PHYTSLIVSLRLPPLPSCSPFPYTTLFRSIEHPDVFRVGALAAVFLADDAVIGKGAANERAHRRFRGMVGGGNGDAHAHSPHLRSEEHTSELQSLTNLVCRLLLEKKKRTDR